MSILKHFRISSNFENQSPLTGWFLFAFNMVYNIIFSFWCKTYWRKFYLYLWIWYLAGTCPASRYMICHGNCIPVSALKIFVTWFSSILLSSLNSFSVMLCIASAPYNTLLIINELRKINPHSKVVLTCLECLYYLALHQTDSLG